MTVEYRTSRIKEAILEQGACHAGVADLSGLGLPATAQYPFAISFTIRYDDEIVNQLPNDEPWNEIALSLTERARHIYEHVQTLIASWGYTSSRVPSSTRIDEFPEPGEQLPQKTLATLSGIGWIGKSSLLITPSEGPRVRPGTLLTNMPLKNDTPIVRSNCGQCRACVDICPVGAIRGLTGHKASLEVSFSMCDGATIIYGTKWIL